MEYGDDALVSFPLGLPGFEGESSFVLIQLAEQFPLVYLQSAANADLCFLALPPKAINSAYELQISEEDARTLEVRTKPHIGNDVLALVLVTICEGAPHANMLGPIVINLRSRTGLQCINQVGDHSHHEAIVLAEETAA